MRAIWYEDFGPAKDVLVSGEKEAPLPSSGEVLVKVAYNGINPVDVKRRAGGRGDMTDPYVIPHLDASGIIEDVGESVDKSRIGERVWMFETQWQTPHGAAAEYTCVPNSRAVHLPNNAGLDEGSCLGVPALTAHRCVYGDGPVEGKIVLVTGAAGAVGNYAVQFAKFGGATVIATISGDKKADLARKAGADHIINYRTENVAEAINEITNGAGVDRIVEVEFGGNIETSIAVLKTNGVIATYASDANKEPNVPFYQLIYKNIVVRHELVFIMPEDAKDHAVDDISSWLADGRIMHHISETFSLSNIIKAHEAVEGGAYGKVLIDLNAG
ncbi:MAG: NADPH:quinone reductase [Rhodospirillales bacterium]|jgi:NADPH:quinone reductase|nr:NADPH:quinone reductase [Rhodospirillales bacterium]